MSTLLLLATAFGQPAIAARPDLKGTITDPGGKAVPGATVFIYTAAPRTGYSAFCPSCYPDCRKSATTAADGSFHVPSLDPELLFRVLVVGNGFAPSFAAAVDPAAGPLAVTLRPPDPARAAPTHSLRGRVLDDKGNPVVGATLDPYGFKTPSWSGFKRGILDPVAVTDRDGRFLLTSAEPVEYAVLRVEARGLAGRLTPQLPAGGGHVITLTAGAFLAGRVVRDGKAVPGAVLGVGMTQESHDQYQHHDTIAADKDGRFLFSNVPPGAEYFVYGLQNTLPGEQVIPATRVRAGADGTTTELGVLAPRPGLTLAGRIHLSDGRPLPEKTRLTVSRDGMRDSRTVEPAADGRFEVRGLPPGEELSVFAGIRGYRLARANASRDPLGGTRLMGRLEADTRGLIMLFEPGEAVQDLEEAARLRFLELRRTPIRGAPTVGDR
ncbi:hypothetical protein J0H58_38495 [bacterium]|nr:hypothetical protein [bacterium]